MLGQLLAIKKCRESALRHRAAVIQSEIEERERKRESEIAARRQLRADWRRESDTEHAVGPRDFPKVKRMFAEFYRKEQAHQANLQHLSDEITSRTASAGETARRLKENLRGQEKLRFVMEASP